MMSRAATIVFGAAILWDLRQPAHRPRFAQTTCQNYRCADGSQFLVGFSDPTSVPICRSTAKAVTLGKRLALSGSRYLGPRRHVDARQGRRHGSSTAIGRRRPANSIEKGPKRFRFDPFHSHSIVHRSSADASATVWLMASALTHRLGVLDRRVVIPGAAASQPR
jgi:hypothetical protein